jgi:hypothetical protein
MTETLETTANKPRETAAPRTIARVVKGTPTSDGAGVKLTRFVGTPALPRVDPFLMLDNFRSDEPSDYLAGFPDHPHRGFETITYMIAGRFRHHDNKGHSGLLESGGAQWMTAGRGIVHSEMPEQEEGLVSGFQLWLNLPASEKMRPAEYKDIQRWDIPVAKLDGGAEARVLAGEMLGVVGPISGRSTEPVLVDVSLPPNTSVTVPLSEAHMGFVLTFEGAPVRVGESAIGKDELGVLSAGGALTLRSGDHASRVLLVAGKPIKEPIAQLGPFVMNTPDEIRQAVRDFEAGKF